MRLRATTDTSRSQVVLAVVGTFVAYNVIVFAFGESPLVMVARAFAGSWGTSYGIGQVLFKATPLLFTGLAFQVGFRAGLFNIGAEGQLAVASLSGAIVAARLPSGTPPLVAVPLVLGFAALAGAIAALPPAWMRARLGVHEIITTIMMNRMIEVVVPWVLGAVLRSPSLRTPDIVGGARLLRAESLVPSLSGSALSIAFFLAIGTAVMMHYWFVRSRIGREMQWVGWNAEACLSEGVPVKRRWLQAMLLSGALAGLGMSGTVLGYKGYFEFGLGAGAGFSGVAVALLGRGSAWGIVLAAIALGTLDQAGLAINASVPREAMDVLEAVAIVLVASRGRPLRWPTKGAVAQ